MQFVRSEQRDELLGKLTPEEQKLYEDLAPSYRRYIQDGQQASYQTLVEKVRETIPDFKPEPKQTKPQEEEPEMSPEMRDLMKEIESMRDQVGPPGTSKDPGIPPEDSDEYHTPALPSSAEETSASRPLFEIKPAGSSKEVLLGSYCCGRKSYYDIQSKTWSKKKQLNPYTSSISGDLRQNISGTMGKGITAIPLPNSYALDISSLRITGNQGRIYRDQNGCFYIESDGMCTFSADFLQEKPPFVSRPIEEDLKPIYEGMLSSQTEDIIHSLSGSNLNKADKTRQYILSHHYYPAGGDRNVAQALQLKLRSSPSNQYIQNLDLSEYLECYSANTLFIAMMRKAGVPARLVIGHRVQNANGGKAAIDTSNGHAWAEVWDGIAWRRFDATPKPKPEDKPADQKPGDDTPTQSADDGGIEQPPTPPQDAKDRKQKGAKPKGGSQQPGQQMEEASDSDVKSGESTLQQAEEKLEQMEKRQADLRRKINDAKSFKDLKKLEQEVQDSELLEDMAEDLDQSLEAKEEQMKREIKEKVDELQQDGFMEDGEANRLKELLDQTELDKLDQLKQQIEQENQLHNEYEEIKAEVMPQVNFWYRYFVSKLPREEEFEVDDTSLGRSGRFDKKAAMRPRNLYMGNVKYPRVISPSVKPMFIAYKVLDVSGSMGEGNKLRMARKFLVFTNELFAKIGKEYGYIRSADYVFSDSLSAIKTPDQEYDSPQRYPYPDGTRSTVKARLMKATTPQGGTDMLNAVRGVARDLNIYLRAYPDYLSAVYFMGDGEDTCGNAENIRKFLATEDSEHGFGRHLLWAIMLGPESIREKLGEIFGEERTSVANKFDRLIERYMRRFDEDIQTYLKRMKPRKSF